MKDAMLFLSNDMIDQSYCNILNWMISLEVLPPFFHVDFNEASPKICETIPSNTSEYHKYLRMNNINIESPYEKRQLQHVYKYSKSTLLYI